MLTPTRAPVEVTRPSATRRMRRPPARPVGWRRARRIAVAASALCLIPALVSYVHAIAQSSNSGLGIRMVEWLRDNGARGIVNDVENLYYSLTAPSKGGPALHALPKQAGTAAAAPGVPHRVHHTTARRGSARSSSRRFRVRVSGTPRLSPAARA